MQLLSGYDLYKGKRLNAYGASSGFYQPLQFLSTKEKDDQWVAQMMNYVDWQALKQVRENANWMIKNSRLAIGEIEKTDYIRQDNEYADMIDALEQHAGRPLEALEIKNYAFANTVVNILCDEFAKRSSHMSFTDKSPQWANQMLKAKREDIEQVLEQKAAINQMLALQKMGLSPDSEQGKQALDPKTIKSLPEVQRYYNKSYRDIYQQWAEKQMAFDNERFCMPELERRQFRNMLITDREFWHFRMLENDYEIECWNPPQVAYRKSPAVRYISDAAWIDHIDYMTVPDAVDRYGFMMSEKQLLSLNTLHGARAASYALDGKEPDQYYDGHKSYDWNRTGPGIAMRQTMSVLDNVQGWGGDTVKQLLNESEDIVNINGEFMVRVSTIYWKTERKFFHLTKVDDNGNMIQDIVGEDYKVTTKPMYNTILFKEKTKENLVYGEHLDPLWANETWGGIRIGTNAPAIGWQGTSTSFAPIYLGINTPIPGRLPFQFKGDKNIYGCKLPVEGRVFNDYNTKSRAFIDNLKPYQIGVNMGMNLLVDTMINDLGVIAAIDPDALAKHSLGEDWGPNTWAAAMTVIKTGGAVPMKGGGMKNADGQMIGHEPLRRVDLSQTERLMGLMKIIDWLKMTGLDSVGMNPRRTGTPIGQESTATEVTQDIASSYSHTEYLFYQHCDELMPRVHQMRTDMAQYYNSTNPSLRLQYITESDEQAFFEYDGTGLLGRDYNCKATTTINARSIMNKIEQMIIQDSSAADIFDKVKMVQVPTLSAVNNTISELQQKQQEKIQQEQQAEQEQQKAEQDHEMQLLQEKQQFEASEAEKDREAENYRAELAAASKAATAKPPEEGESAYQDATKQLQSNQQHQDKMDLENRKLETSTALKKEEQNIQKQKVRAEENRTQETLRTARIIHNQKEKNKPKK